MTPNMEISTVVGCRMNCGYCPQKLHVKKYSLTNTVFAMSMETFETCLSKIPLDVEIIFAGMAEPWLNPNCTDMLLLAHSRGYKIGVYTTTVGMMFDDIDKIKRLPFIHFCLHLPDDAGVMRVKVDESYLNVLRHAMQIKHNFMCIGNVHPLVKEVTGEVEDSSNALISRAGNLKTLAAVYKTGKIRCSACGPVIDHNILLPNGEVLLCCMTYGMESILGNLLECSYAELFTGKEYQRIAQGLEDDGLDIPCRKCEVATND